MSEQVQLKAGDWFWIVVCLLLVVVYFAGLVINGGLADWFVTGLAVIVLLVGVAS